MLPLKPLRRDDYKTLYIQLADRITEYIGENIEGIQSLEERLAKLDKPVRNIFLEA